MAPQAPPSTPTSSVKQALAALRQLQAELDELKLQSAEPIAILGMGCRYPGADNPKDLWQLLLKGTDTISDVPLDRWDSEALFDPDPAKPGTIPSRRGGFLHNLDSMDAAFFGIPPREAPHIDPRQRVMLEIAWEALEDAGIPPDSLSGSQTGVFIATLTNDYDHLLFSDLRRAEIYSGAGTANSVVANRLSYFLDVHGPSVALDTACSGSLVALHLACESLRKGESTLALAGGVSINLMAKSNVFFARSGALSSHSLCRTFDAAADGIVRSDGAGVVVLKRLSKAQRDGDPILAVILGSAVNHDGRSNGIMAPNGAAQRSVLEEAYRRASISPQAVQYVELHGTGTPLGDPIEAHALLDVLGRNGEDDRECIVGSVKSNLGHSEAAAGIAGVIKSVLAMQHRKIPPTAHFEKLNPLIPFHGTGFRVASSVRSWPSPDQPLIAGVSGFGFGGTNAHVVLAESPAQPADASDDLAGRTWLLPISAATPSALSQIASLYAARLQVTNARAEAVCKSAALGRTHMACRAAVAGRSCQELAAALENLKTTVLERVAPRSARLAFVFSGQGSHWARMGMQLYDQMPLFRGALDRCDQLLENEHGLPLLASLRNEAMLANTDYVQPAIFSMQVALAELWRSWGVQPDFVVGHSLGEAAAACFAGILSLEDALRVVVLRSRLMKRVAGRGKTAVVRLSLPEAEARIAEFEPHVAIAGSNSPSSTVISGTPGSVDRLMQLLGAEGIHCREIVGVDIAFHSPQMDPLQRELVDLLTGLQPRSADIPIMSSVTADLMQGEQFGAAYWGRNLREPFLFGDATLGLLQRGCTTFVEISPHAVLSASVMQTAQSEQISIMALPSLLKASADETSSMYASLARLYAEGRHARWEAVYPERGRLIELPHYPWQRQRYWFDQLDKKPGPRPHPEHSNNLPILGERIDAATGTAKTFWRNSISIHAPGYSIEHKVRGIATVPGSLWLEMVRNAGEACLDGSVAVHDVVFEATLPVSDEQRELQTIFTPHPHGGQVEIFSRSAGGAWVRHVHGEVRKLPSDAAMTVEMGALEDRCQKVVAPSEHYARMLGNGLEYGPHFQLLDSIHSGDAEAVATITPSRSTTKSRSGGLHPTVLDAALQLTAVAQGNSGFSYLPAGVGQYELFASPSGALRGYATLRGASGAPSLEADVELLSQSGMLVARLRGIKLQRTIPTRSIPKSLRDGLIQETWVAQKLATATPVSSGNWLLLGNSDISLRLASALRSNGHRAAIATTGTHFRQVDPDHFEVGLDLAGDLGRILECGKWTNVVVLPPSPDSDAAWKLPLAIVQAILRAQSATSLWFLTRGAQSIAPGVILPAQATIAGLGLAVAYESPELHCSTIDLDTESDSVEELVEELTRGGEEVRTVLRGKERFVSRIDALTVPHSGKRTLNPDATYLITGGLGSLGFKSAERMVSEGARHLVLTSRTAAKTAVVEDLQKSGASIHVVACDLEKPSEVDRLFQDVLAGMPPLRGIVHSAGVLEDALLLDQTPAHFHRVMAAKQFGAWNLHTASQSHPLDFFVLYSSAASLLGSGGQANYAAANSFLDALAHHRRSIGLPATSVNWGAWGGEGMAGRSELAGRLAARGVKLIDPKDGLDVLSFVISGAVLPAQFGVFPADWQTFISQQPSRMRGRFARPTEDVQSLPDRSSLMGRRENVPVQIADLHEHVHRTLASVLGYRSPFELNAQQRFFELGMDSLTAVEFRNRLQEDLQVTLPATVAFDYPDVSRLAEYLAGKVASGREADRSNLRTGDAQTSGIASGDGLDGLTSDELAQLLRKELREETADAC